MGINLKRLYSQFIRFSSQRYVLIIIALLVLMTGECLYLKNHLNIDTDLKSLFKGTNVTVIELEKMEERVGSHSTVLVVASSPDREKNIKALSNIKSEIESDPAIRFVDFDRDVEYLEKHALLFASVEELEKIRDTIREEIAGQVERSLSLEDGDTFTTESPVDDKLNSVIKESEKYRKSFKLNKYYEAKNGTLMAMKVRPAGSETSVEDTKKVVEILDEAIRTTEPEKLGVKVEAGGPFRNKLKEMQAIYNDVFSTLAICIFLLSMTIIYYFRSVRSLFIIFLPLSAGILTAITLMQYFLGGFNIISAFSFSILYGLGIDFGIHLLGRFSEERENTGNCKIALISSSYKAIPAIFAGAATTVAAFLSLAVVDFKGFSDFGMTAAIGVSTAFISTVIFFPAIIFLFERFKPVKFKLHRTGMLASIYRIFSRKPVITCLTFTVITIAAGISTNFISMEYDFNNLTFPGKSDPDSVSTQYIQAVKREKSDFLSTGLPSFILTESKEETEDASRTLDRIKKNNHNSLEFKDYISIYSFIPADQDRKLRIISNIRRMIERKINLFDEKTVNLYNRDFKQYLEVDTPIEQNMLPEWIKDKLSLKDGSCDKLIILGLGGNKSNIDDVITIKKEYGTIKGEKNYYIVLGSYMLIAEIKDAIDKDVPSAIILSMIAVFLMLLLLYRSVSGAVAVFLPLVSGILIMVLFAVGTGIKFNIFNMVVIPTAIGTGIDSAIHIFHRYKTEGVLQMENILKNTGGAVFFSSLTTLVGFGSVAIADHRGLQSIGIMASLGIIAVTAVNLCLFPALLNIYQKFRHSLLLKNEKHGE